MLLAQQAGLLDYLLGPLGLTVRGEQLGQLHHAYHPVFRGGTRFDLLQQGAGTRKVAAVRIRLGKTSSRRPDQRRVSECERLLF